MAVAGGTQPSIFLQLNGRTLHERATMNRQSSVMCDDAPEAWTALLNYGQCYMRLYGDNLNRLRALHDDWVLTLEMEEVDE